MTFVLQLPHRLKQSETTSHDNHRWSTICMPAAAQRWAPLAPPSPAWWWTEVWGRCGRGLGAFQQARVHY